MDSSNAMDRFLRILADEAVGWCVVGGLGVNAYVEPVVTLDMDLVLAAGHTEAVVMAAERAGFMAATFAHSVNVTATGSDLRIQLQTDPRYAAFVDRAVPREVLGTTMPVADVEDLLQGKIWAFQDVHRRASKRQKDLADISRLLEAFPRLRERVPQGVLDRLV